MSPNTAGQTHVYLLLQPCKVDFLTCFSSLSPCSWTSGFCKLHPTFCYC